MSALPSACRSSVGRRNRRSLTPRTSIHAHASDYRNEAVTAFQITVASERVNSQFMEESNCYVSILCSCLYTGILNITVRFREQIFVNYLLICVEFSDTFRSFETQVVEGCHVDFTVIVPKIFMNPVCVHDCSRPKIRHDPCVRVGDGF